MCIPPGSPICSPSTASGFRRASSPGTSLICSATSVRAWWRRQVFWKSATNLSLPTAVNQTSWRPTRGNGLWMACPTTCSRICWAVAIATPRNCPIRPGRCSETSSGGWQRVQAICDYVHHHIEFGYHHARGDRTAAEGHEERIGVCRDFAHLAVSLCRCMNIPARYCTGYLGDIGVPADPAPMDFSAWFEVFLGGTWYTFDARHNHPRIGRIVIARGRDAADVAISTIFGPAPLARFKVITDETPDLQNVPLAESRAPLVRLLPTSPSCKLYRISRRCRNVRAAPVSDPSITSRWISATGLHGPRSRCAGRAVHQGISSRRSLPFHPKAPRLFRQGPFAPARTRAGCSMPVGGSSRSVSSGKGDLSSLRGARQQGLLRRAVLFGDRRRRECKRSDEQYDARTNKTEKDPLHHNQRAAEPAVPVNACTTKIDRRIVAELVPACIGPG